MTYDGQEPDMVIVFEDYGPVQTRPYNCDNDYLGVID